MNVSLVKCFFGVQTDQAYQSYKHHSDIQMSDTSLFIYSIAAISVCLLKLLFSVVLALHAVLLELISARFYFISGCSLYIAKIKRPSLISFLC